MQKQCNKKENTTHKEKQNEQQIKNTTIKQNQKQEKTQQHNKHNKNTNNNSYKTTQTQCNQQKNKKEKLKAQKQKENTVKTNQVGRKIQIFTNPRSEKWKTL